jgi:hypothetical protein
LGAACDLYAGTKTETVFETDTTLYNVAEGAWDCIVTLPAEDGSLYGYFFADAKKREPVAGVRGGGFAHSVRLPERLSIAQILQPRSSLFC